MIFSQARLLLLVHYVLLSVVCTDFADQLERLLQQTDWGETPPLAPAKHDVIASYENSMRKSIYQN
jgi:hypothetical protein